MVKDVAKDVAIAVISSACVGLATIAGIVLINQYKIGDLQDDLKDLETEVNKQECQLEKVKHNLMVLELKDISPESANRLSPLNCKEANILSQLQPTDSARPSSGPQLSSSGELFSKDNFSPELLEVIESYQLTETDLENYWYLMKSYE